MTRLHGAAAVPPLLLLVCLMSDVVGCASDAPSFFDAGEIEVATRARYEGVGTAPAAEAAMDAPAPARAPAPGPALPDLVEPAAAAAAATRPAPDAGEPRVVVYSAAFRVVVANVPGALRSIREQAEQLGGYLQEVSGSSITVRVPVGRFNDAVAFVERVGEVVDRQLKAQDVTEELRDLRLHLDNAEKLRQRLQALLDKAERVEDVLKIEAELTRVTEEIDRTKGKLRFLESQVAMSSLRVELNASVAQNQQGTGPRLPFDWVNELGAGLVEGQVQQDVRRAGIFGRGPKFQTPAGFVRYYENSGQAEAMDAGGLRIRVLRRANVDKAGLAFWSQLARRSLVEGRSLAVTAEEGGAAGDGYYFLRGTRQVGGKLVGYLLSIERSNRAVVAFEAWGPAEEFDANLDALREAALSADPG